MTNDILRGVPDVPTAHLMAREQIPNAPWEWARWFYRIDRHVDVAQRALPGVGTVA